MTTDELGKLNAEIYKLMAEKELSTTEVIKLCANCIAIAFGDALTSKEIIATIVGATVIELNNAISTILKHKEP